MKKYPKMTFAALSAIVLNFSCLAMDSQRNDAPEQNPNEVRIYKSTNKRTLTPLSIERAIKLFENPDLVSTALPADIVLLFNYLAQIPEEEFSFPSTNSLPYEPPANKKLPVPPTLEEKVFIMKRAVHENDFSIFHRIFNDFMPHIEESDQLKVLKNLQDETLHSLVINTNYAYDTSCILKTILEKKHKLDNSSYKYEIEVISLAIRDNPFFFEKNRELAIEAIISSIETKEIPQMFIVNLLPSEESVEKKYDSNTRAAVFSVLDKLASIGQPVTINVPIVRRRIFKNLKSYITESTPSNDIPIFLLKKNFPKLFYTHSDRILQNAIIKNSRAVLDIFSNPSKKVTASPENISLAIVNFLTHFDDESDEECCYKNSDPYRNIPLYERILITCVKNADLMGSLDPIINTIKQVSRTDTLPVYKKTSLSINILIQEVLRIIKENNPILDSYLYMSSQYIRNLSSDHIPAGDVLSSRGDISRILDLSQNWGTEVYLPPWV